MERNDLLLEIVERDYERYSGLVLEQYFRQKWMEEERVTVVGNYWVVLLRFSNLLLRMKKFSEEF